jgi:hypothetical protein
MVSLPDVADPRAFMIAATAIFAHYPAETWEGVLAEVKPRPELADIKAACERAYEPIERRTDRDRARLALPAPERLPRTSEQQAAIDAQVEAARLQLGMPDALPRRPDQPASDRHDGKHYQRIAADLEARRARKEGPEP